MTNQQSRRTFLADTGMGFTGLALGAMLHEDAVADQAAGRGTRLEAEPHFPAKADSVISVNVPSLLLTNRRSVMASLSCLAISSSPRADL